MDENGRKWKWTKWAAINGQHPTDNDKWTFVIVHFLSFSNKFAR
jgi:hypothetical protein